MGREQEARDDAHAAGGGQGEPADQEAQPSSDGTDDGRCPPTHGIRHAAAASRWLQVQREGLHETDPATRRETAATDNETAGLKRRREPGLKKELHAAVNSV